MPKKKTIRKSKGPEPKVPVETPKDKSGEPERKPFPIIGLGASAGGLEALKTFFSHVSRETPMAYVVIVHMTPDQPSMMAELLQNVAPIPITPAKDGEPVEPGHAYVIPPDKDISIFKGIIQLLKPVKKPRSLPIDLFFRALAKDQGKHAVAIVFSGTGTDGTLGIKDIKENDGLILVQSEETAGYNGMPLSAINTGLVDMVLAPGEMPDKIASYFSHPATHFGAKPTTTDEERGWLHKIFAVLRTQIGHDFSTYKTNTILRRIGRRMGLNHIKNHETYVRYLRENPDEVEALFRELLIGVTNFFRDAESFEILKNTVLPKFFEDTAENITFRAWIPGCSTGEEVYSMAMVLREILTRSGRHITLQLFGTDIDKYAIEKAREGLFPASISADISEERLKRFFVKEGDFYRISKEIRDCAVFSVQDVLKDPPFSRLNLLCCRNLLIYLNAKAQKKLLPLFHYTLNPEGILVLGSSETIGGFTTLFETIDKKWKIFKRREIPQAMRQIIDFPSGTIPEAPDQEPMPAAIPTERLDMGRLTRRAVLNQFSPTAVLINTRGEILHVHGRTGKYLETPSGPPTHNILDLAREGLRIELSSAIRTAKSSGPVTRKRLSVRTNGDRQMIDLHVSPQTSPKELAGHLLVVFEDLPMDALVKGDRNAPAEGPSESSRIGELERELQITRESHQTTIEELESSNEELKSTNEEMQSSNEELQSTNEELESSKEELQSLNEELQTVNAELQSKVEELSNAHDDMRNLLNSTEVATLFVDNDLQVRRFTHQATTIINLIPTDIGRPLKHVVSNLHYDNMIYDLKQVLKNLAPRETEVRTAKGEWFNMRIMPYRTTDNRIDGAVLTFSAIGDQKKAQEMLEASIKRIENALELVNAVFDINPEPMAVLDDQGDVMIANKGFAGLVNTEPHKICGMAADKLLEQFALPKDLPQQLKTALKENKGFRTEPFETKGPKGMEKCFIQGNIIKQDKAFPYRILLNFKKSGERTDENG